MSLAEATTSFGWKCSMSPRVISHKKFNMIFLLWVASVTLLRMSRVLRYFMWGYQSSFLSSLSYAAEKVFTTLDPKLVPRVFLVGILEDTSKEHRHSLCIEPEEGTFDPNDLGNILEVAQTLFDTHEDRNTLHTDLGVHEADKRRRYLGCVREATLQALNAHTFSVGRDTYCSYPAKVDGYLVFAVLQLLSTAMSSHPRLHHKRMAARYPVCLSLIEAAIRKVLEEATVGMQYPGAYELPLNRREDERLRDAGEDLAFTASSINDFVPNQLFSKLNRLALAQYEKSSAKGAIVIAKPGNSMIRSIISLAAPVPLSNTRAVRKLLELSSIETPLLSNSHNVYGIGRIDADYDGKTEDIFLVTFNGGSSWSLRSAREELMRVTYGIPGLPTKPYKEELLRDHAVRLFPTVTESAVKNLSKVLDQVILSTKGTTLVISPDAHGEAMRLSPQCTAISPTLISPDMVNLLMSIDGGVLLDQAGCCHAIGVILDGIVSQGGDPGRGGRYNSAVKYVKSKPGTLAIVVSDDGTVDLVPYLRPMIQRTSIDQAIAELVSLQKGSQLNVKRYYQLMSWLEAHQFYLSKDDCELINSRRKEIDGGWDHEHHNALIMRHDLQPNLEMNDTYYFQ